MNKKLSLVEMFRKDRYLGPIFIPFQATFQEIFSLSSKMTTRNNFT